MQEPTTLFPVLLLPGSTRMDKELDQNKKVLEANLLKLLDPGQYYNPHLVKQLNEAGITVPDRNILSQLTDKSKLRDNGCIEYLRSKQQRQRKLTEYDHELYTYPYNYKQLHDDHVDNRVGTHYDREAPALDEVLLTAETAENVFRKNKRAADTAVQKCIADTFFAGDITGIAVVCFSLYVCNICDSICRCRSAQDSRRRGVYDRQRKGQHDHSSLQDHYHRRTQKIRYRPSCQQTLQAANFGS